MSSSTIISQAYFDELCIENADVFDLNEEDAVKESLDQLPSSSSSSQQLCHLTLTFPTSKAGVQERTRRNKFRKALESLNNNYDDEATEAILEMIGQNDNDETTKMSARCPLLYLFIHLNGWKTVLQALARHIENGDDAGLLLELVQKLLEVSLMEEDNLLASFQEFAPVVIDPCLTNWYPSLASDGRSKAKILNQMWLLTHWSCKRCERNKQLWMQQRDDDKRISLAKALKETLRSCCLNNKDDAIELVETTCRLITVLCTFDDFSSSKSAQPAAVTHDNVQKFNELGMVPLLHDLLKDQGGSSSPSSSTACVVAALRALAIQDSIVRSMLSLGVVDTCRDLLVQALRGEEQSSVFLVANVLGLFRNLAANDQVKLAFCKKRETGEQATVSALVVSCMMQFPSVAALQEHACGLIAALSLRQPANAEYLVQDLHAHTAIVSAMRQFPTIATLQRQGALALRNLASRSPPQLHQTILEAGAKDVLTTRFAATTCPDEAFAALRDLGISQARLLHVVVVAAQEDGGGNKKVQLQPTRQFGQGRNPNFRPEYD